MTRNQIEYAKLMETRRSNLVQEELTRRRDAETYSYRDREVDEVKRHNREVEDQALMQIGVSNANLRVSAANAEANLRSANARLSDAYTNRYNAETNRRNSEINALNAESQRLQANAALATSQANLSQARVAQMRQAEEARHNQFSEQAAVVDLYRNIYSAESERMRAAATQQQAQVAETRSETEKQQLEHQIEFDNRKLNQEDRRLDQGDVSLRIAEEKAVTSELTNLSQWWMSLQGFGTRYPSSVVVPMG